jgi:hypothetical protein
MKILIGIATSAFYLTSCVSGAKTESIRALSSQANGIQSAILPCQLHFNLCYVQATFNDSRPLDVVVDTGSSLSVLNLSTRPFPVLHKISEGDAAGPGAAGSRYILFDHVSISMGSILIPGQSIISIPFDYVSERTGSRTDGAIGSNLFQHYIVKFDYGGSSIEIFDPTHFIPEQSYRLVPLDFEGNVPVIEAEVRTQAGRAVRGRFLVDTGQILAGLIISKSFERSHPEAFRHLKKGAVETVAAVGGSVKFRRGKVPSVAIGDSELGFANTAFLVNEAGVYAKKDIAGGIGPELLKQFDVIFDYANKRMLLRPRTEQ